MTHINELDSSSIVYRLNDVLDSGQRSREDFAAALGVSVSTIARWKSGQSAPQAKHLRKLNSMLSDMPRSGAQIPTEMKVSSYERSKFYKVLVEIRESIHRSGKLSSRNEALEELTKLLFAHVIAKAHGHSGIDAISDLAPATALQAFVTHAYSKHVPKALLQQIGDRASQLRLGGGDDDFANEIIGCFKSLSDETISRSFQGLDGVDIINEAFGQFLTSAFSDEKEFGQYLTPHSVVSFMTLMAVNSLPPSMIEEFLEPIAGGTQGVVLDPSCGTGSFLTEFVRTLYPVVLSRSGASGAKQWLQKTLGSSVIGIDKSDRMVQLALTNFALFGAEKASLFCANGLKRDGGLTEAIEGNISLILTNPPFGAEITGPDLQTYKLNNSWSDRAPKKINSELLFFERYFDWLRPGGILASIVPDSILYNKGLYEGLRKGLAQHVELVACVSLPAVTFAGAGTSTKTSVLVLRKKSTEASETESSFFAVCDDIGFRVVSRGAHRQVIESGTSQLPEILSAFIAQEEPSFGVRMKVDLSNERWDATFHAGLTAEARKKLEQNDLLTVSQVAKLKTRKTNPKKWEAAEFRYIEISDVVGMDNTVRCKSVASGDAPSRAKKLVKSNDVLVSTVRPELKTIGVVPPHLDGSVCTTGFAVLECRGISPLVLAKLLQTEFSNCQILRNNVGISYPAIHEESLLKVKLPVAKKELHALEEAARHVQERRMELEAAESVLKAALAGLSLS